MKSFLFPSAQKIILRETANTDFSEFSHVLCYHGWEIGKKNVQCCLFFHMFTWANAGWFIAVTGLRQQEPIYQWSNESVTYKHVFIWTLFFPLKYDNVNPWLETEMFQSVTHDVQWYKFLGHQNMNAYSPKHSCFISS